MKDELREQIFMLLDENYGMELGSFVVAHQLIVMEFRVPQSEAIRAVTDWVQSRGIRLPRIDIVTST